MIPLIQTTPFVNPVGSKNVSIGVPSIVKCARKNIGDEDVEEVGVEDEAEEEVEV